MSIRNLAYSAALILCLAIPSANSAVITMEIDGFVNEVRPIFAPLVSLGDEMTATFSFDPTSVTRSITHNSGTRSHILSVLDYRVSMGGVTVIGSGGRADVRYNVGSLGDRIVLGSFDSRAVSAPALEELHDINALYVGVALWPIAGELSSSEMPTSISQDSFHMRGATIQMEVAGGDFVWQALVAMFEEATQIVDFLSKPDEVKGMKKKIKHAVLDCSFGDKALVAVVQDRFMDLGKVKFKS